MEENKINIVAATVSLLSNNNFYGISNDIEVVKGKYKLKSIFNKKAIVRAWYMGIKNTEGKDERL